MKQATLPLNPKPPAKIPADVWQRISLAKRRLATLGPLEAGQVAARGSAYILASELRLAGLPVGAAVELARSLTFTANTTPRRLVLKQMERAAEWAYTTKDGLPILTGCCRDPRPRSGDHTGGRLRSYFEPYCDDDCAKTCPMLRAIKRPLVALSDTPFAAVDNSNVWQYGTGLGECGQFVYQMLANLALGIPDTQVFANANYLTMKLDGRFSVRQIRHVLSRLADPDIRLIELRKKGIILVRAPDAAELRSIERRLHVTGKREANVREARNERPRLDDWLALVASQGGDEEAWNPAPVGAAKDKE